MARQMITCESCGRRYDYLESESCPYCGAFNYDKAIGSHLCTTEDVERIVEMRTPEHFDDEPDPQPEGLDKGLLRKYARARRRLDRLETTEDVFRSALQGSRDSARQERPEKKKKPHRVRTVLVIFAGIWVLAMVLSVLASLFDSLSAPSYHEPSYSYTDAEIADSFETIYGIQDTEYAAEEFHFTVGDMAVIDTATPEDGMVVVGVYLDGWSAASNDDYAAVNSNPELVVASTGEGYRYSPIDTLYGDEEELRTMFGYDSLSFLQPYEISYLSGGNAVRGYIPFLVDEDDLDDLCFSLTLTWYSDDYLSHQETMEMQISRVDESNQLINETNTKQVMEEIKARFRVDIPQEEFDFYFENMRFNSLTQSLLHAFFSKYFNDTNAIRLLDKRNAVELAVYMKKFLQLRGMIILPQICTAKVRGKFKDTCIKNAKFLERFTTSSVYQHIISEKYRYIKELGLKEDPIVKMLSTMLNSSFEFVDTDPEVNGRICDNINADMMVNELMLFLSIC